jgi:ferredoxin--NADP+ reductase
MDDGKIVPQLYTAGWIKRGPSGIIGTNRACSVETVNSLLEDLGTLSSVEINTDPQDLQQLIDNRGVRTISFDEWQRIDVAEVARGAEANKPREKFTSIEEMFAVLSRP